MTFLALGACFALAGFLAADLAATAWVAAAFAFLDARAARWSPSRRAWLLAATRMVPGLAALLFAGAVVVRGYARL
jgi:hypothetical protein